MKGILNKYRLACIILITLYFSHPAGAQRYEPAAAHMLTDLTNGTDATIPLPLVKSFRLEKALTHRDSLWSEISRISDSLFRKGYIREYIQVYEFLEPYLGVWQRSSRSYYSQAEYCNNVGNAYYALGDYQNSLRNFYYSLELLESASPDKDREIMRANTYYNLAHVYLRLKDSRQMKLFMERAKEIAAAAQIHTLSAMLFVLDGIMQSSENPWIAVSYYHKALRIAGENYYKDIWDAARIELSAVYMQLNMPREALEWAEKEYPYDSVTRINTVNLHSEIAQFGQLGDIYTDLGHYADAERSYLHALEAARQFHANPRVLILYGRLAGLYEKAGNYVKAAHYLKSYIQLSGTQLNEEKLNAISSFEVRYHTAEKDRALSEKELLIALRDRSIARRNLIIIGIGSGVLLLGAALLLLLRSMRHREQLHRKDQEVQMLRAFISGEERERSRIARELHDGIGSILSAAKLSLSNVRFGDNSDSPPFRNGMTLLDQAYTEMRQMAHNLSPEFLKNNGLAEALRLFCHKVTGSGRISICFEALDPVPGLPESVSLGLYRIVQELLHNIIKHADATEVLVQLSIEGGSMLKIVIEDNGNGTFTAPGTLSGGTGIQNQQARIASLSGSMETDSRPGTGTTCYLEFNLINLHNFA